MLAAPRHHPQTAKRFEYDFPVFPAPSTSSSVSPPPSSYHYQSRPRRPSSASTSTAASSSSSSASSSTSSSSSSPSYPYPYSRAQPAAITIPISFDALSSDSDSSTHAKSDHLSPPSSPIISGSNRRRSVELERDGAERRLSEELIREGSRPRSRGRELGGERERGRSPVHSRHTVVKQQGWAKWEQELEHQPPVVVDDIDEELDRQRYVHHNSFLYTWMQS